MVAGQVGERAGDVVDDGGGLGGVATCQVDNYADDDPGDHFPSEPTAFAVVSATTHFGFLRVVAGNLLTFPMRPFAPLKSLRNRHANKMQKNATGAQAE
jgi:hypothetical protein